MIIHPLKNNTRKKGNNNANDVDEGIKANKYFELLFVSFGLNVEEIDQNTPLIAIDITMKPKLKATKPFMKGKHNRTGNKWRAHAKNSIVFRNDG